MESTQRTVFETAKERKTRAILQSSSYVPETEETEIELVSINITDNTFKELQEKHFSEENGIKKIRIVKVTMTLHACEQFCDLLESEHCTITKFHLESCKMMSRIISMLFESVKRIPTLKGLTIKNTILTKNNILELGSLLQANKLEQLTLHQIGLSGESFLNIQEQFESMKNIICLDLRKNVLGVIGLEALLRGICYLKKLKIFKINSLEMTTSEIDQLRDVCEALSPNLISLQLESIDSREETGFVTCINHLSLLRNLKVLSLQQNIMQQPEVTALADFLKLKNDLVQLQLSGCGIDNEELEQLANSLEPMQIENLNLSRNEFNGEAADSLVKILDKCEKLERLTLHSNMLGSHDLQELAQAVRSHNSIAHLDMSENIITNQNFIQFFEEVTMDLSQIKELYFSGNKIGGSELNHLLVVKSSQLRVLDLSDNCLDDNNGMDLLQYVTKNVMVQQVRVQRNLKINPIVIQQILDESKNNVMIQTHVLPRLAKTNFESTLGKHSQFGGYDVSHLKLENAVFSKLDFLTKFFELNREHFRELYFSNVKILRDVFSNADATFVGNNLRLRVINLEQTNITLEHLTQLIAECKTNTKLQEFSLKKIDGVNNVMEHLASSFAKHKTLKLLRLVDCDIKDYQNLIPLLQQNKAITELDLRGNKMNSTALIHLWLGIKFNITVYELLYSRSGAFYDLAIIKALEDEQTKNKVIENEIKQVIKSLQKDSKKSVLNLQGYELKEYDAIIKYFTKKPQIRVLNLTRTNLQDRHIKKLIIEISRHNISLSSLNLSENDSINDETAGTLSLLFYTKSSVKELILDKTQIGFSGLEDILKSTTSNMKINTLSFADCTQINFETEKQRTDILGHLSQNLSITSLNLTGVTDDQKFLSAVEQELLLNEEIVTKIFPKMIKQEKDARQELKAMRRFSKELVKQNVGNMSQAQRQLLSNLSANPFLNSDQLRLGQSPNRIKETPNRIKEENPSQSVMSPTVRSEDESYEEDSNVSIINDMHAGLVKFHLSFADMQLENMKFLAKFVREFQHIEQIDFGDQELGKEDAQHLNNALKFNRCLMDIKTKKQGSNDRLKNLFNEELQKNKVIKELNQKQGRQSHLLVEDLKDFSVLPKMVQDFSRLKCLDLSNNDLRQIRAIEQVLQMIDQNETIEKLILRNCKINSKGLSAICNKLAESHNSNLLELDIRDNPIPDPQFKMLFGLLQNNSTIYNIEYTLNDEENIEKIKNFDEILQKKDKQTEQTINEMAKTIISNSGHHGHDEKRSIFSCLCSPCASLIHDKHEAFAFRYNTEALSKVEADLMPSIKFQLYLWTIAYFLIIFMMPFYFTQNDCGKTYEPELYYIYIIYSTLNAIWEIYQVLKIQRYVKSASILQFNKWHFVELLMGQTARLDTFLNVLFAILLGHCASSYMPYFVPATMMIVVNLLFPVTMLIKLIKNKKMALSQPYMESTCFISFIRENMLLATVLDSFCIDNTVILGGKQYVFGKLMGGWSFFTQDLPQGSIHVIFKLVMVSELQKELKTQTLLLVSVIVSFFANSISIFNMIMCDQNEFDPTLMQAEICIRKIRYLEMEEQRQKKKGQGLSKSEQQPKQSSAAGVFKTDIQSGLVNIMRNKKAQGSPQSKQKSSFIERLAKGKKQNRVGTGFVTDIAESNRASGKPPLSQFKPKSPIPEDEESKKTQVGDGQPPSVVSKDKSVVNTGVTKILDDDSANKDDLNVQKKCTEDPQGDAIKSQLDTERVPDDDEPMLILTPKKQFGSSIKTVKTDKTRDDLVFT